MPEKQEPSMDFGPTTQQFDPVSTHDALPAGTRLGGYQIIEVLGRGGFGIVYLALDSSLQRQVAIKEYFPAEFAMRCDDGQVWMKPGADPAAYGAGMKAFLNEAKMLARFDHPSLARVHTFWEENRSAYMVMPYYEGRTLTDVLAERQGPADEAWLRSLLAPLLSALSTLHNAQCLHLDISPDNILVLDDGRPVLLDFGVASRLATDKTMPLTALLNPAYAPIEQYSESVNLQQGPWSDIYALAGVLHFAIAGVPPARATVRAMEDPQRPLAETVASRAQQFPGLSYSATFLAAIDKALAVRPRDRPRGAAEFSLLMDHAAPQQPAPPPGPAPHRASHGPAAFDFAAATGGSGRRTQAHTTEAAADAWIAAEPMDAPPRPKRSRTPMWLATIAVIGLAGAGWTWLQRQPSFANITVSDLPPAIVANIPKPVAEGASAVLALPTEPTSAGPATAAASAAAPAASAPAPVVAQAASAAAPVASAAVSPPSPPAKQAKPAPAKPAPAKATRVAKAAPPRVPPTLPPPEDATADSQAPNATQEPAAREPATREADPPPAATRKPPPKSTASALPPEPSTPRAACGSRSNFALVYCMQQQCKRWKFNTHPQCIEMERRGEL